MARHVTSAAVVLSCLAAQCCAQIRVISPGWLSSSLSNNGKIEGSTATFGAPFYGDEVIGKLVYGASKGGHQHCTEDDYDVPMDAEDSSQDSGARLINIVVVRRGKCSFTTKVKVAYKKGAHAVIIVDQEDSDLKTADLRNIIVGDDGWGDEIHIPSILIAKDEGGKLIDAVTKSQVVVELSWDVPTNHIVEMDLWMSSGSKESLAFLKDFSPKRQMLNEVMKFTPHFAVFSMPSTDPAVYNGMCSDTSGEFCAEDPDGSGLVSGKDVLDEDVRQLCIHELTRVPMAQTEARLGAPTVEFAKQYWHYAEKLLEKCPTDAPEAIKRFGFECSVGLMKEVGLDVDAVQRCVTHSANDKLREQREHTAWSPRAIRINGWRYNGILDADLVTRAVCAGFTKKPTECETLIKPRDPFDIYQGILARDQGVSFKTFALGLLLVIAATFCALCLYRRSVKAHLATSVREEVMLEVQAQMAQYNKL